MRRQRFLRIVQVHWVLFPNEWNREWPMATMSRWVLLSYIFVISRVLHKAVEIICRREHITEAVLSFLNSLWPLFSCQRKRTSECCIGGNISWLIISSFIFGIIKCAFFSTKFHTETHYWPLISVVVDWQFNGQPKLLYFTFISNAISH
jgi:hypothetical protein